MAALELWRGQTLEWGGVQDRKNNPSDATEKKMIKKSGVERTDRNLTLGDIFLPIFLFSLFLQGSSVSFVTKLCGKKLVIDDYVPLSPQPTAVQPSFRPQKRCLYKLSFVVLWFFRLFKPNKHGNNS